MAGRCRPVVNIGCGQKGGFEIHCGMKTKVYGRDNNKDLLFILGWGDKLDSHNLMWLVDVTIGAGFRTHAVELPTAIRDFETEYLSPVREYQGTLGEHVVLANSMGGLVAAYLNAQRKTIYLSPWWGIFGDKLRRTTLRLVSKIGLGIPFLPIDFSREEIGELTVESDWESVPKRATPVWLREIMKAQQNMPPLQRNSVVFCSLKDTVISLKAIGERTNHVILYDGYHELFSSSNREVYREELVNALLW